MSTGSLSRKAEFGRLSNEDRERRSPLESGDERGWWIARAPSAKPRVVFGSAELNEAEKTIAIIIARLSRAGSLAESEEEDFGADLMYELLRAWPGFDSRRGSAGAFITQVLKTRAISLLRKRARIARRPVIPLELPLQDIPSVSDDPLPGVDLKDKMAVELDRVCEELDPASFHIVRILSRSESVAAAARALGMPRSSLRDRLAELKKLFCEAGLDRYAGNPPSNGRVA